jgi:phosphatidylglycerol---prolipoprotein diacylglyceryl transferase
MLPVLFKVGSFPVHTWGFLLMLGFVLATWRAAKNAPRYGFTSEDVWDVSLIGLFGGIVGARLAYIAQNIPHFSQHPGEIFAIWTGGMTSFGGFILGIAAGLTACRFKGMNPGDMADLAAVSLPIGYGLGRVGCFLNGCCYGAACDLPWAVRFHLADGTTTPPSHPAQLYSAIAAVIMFAVLLPLEKNRQFRGQIMLAFLFLYGVYRFLAEIVREGATAQLSGILHLTTGQLASLAMAGAAAVGYAYLLKRARDTSGNT